MRAAKFITLTKLTYNKNIQLNLVCITVKCIKEKGKCIRELIHPSISYHFDHTIIGEWISLTKIVLLLRFARIFEIK